MDADRCGYRLEIGLIDDEFSTDPCDRPTWDDHDHCVWHAKVDGKSKETLAAAEPDPGANLLLATLTDASAMNADFSEATLEGASSRTRTCGGRPSRTRCSTRRSSPTSTSEPEPTSAPSRPTSGRPSSRGRATTTG